MWVQTFAIRILKNYLDPKPDNEIIVIRSGPWQGPRIFINSFLPVKPSKKLRTCSCVTSHSYARAIYLKINRHKVRLII